MSQAGRYFSSLTPPPGTVVTTLTGNVGGAVPPDGAGNIDVLGGNNITTTGNPGTNTLTVDVTGTTNHSLLIGNASGSISSLGVATDGQLPIGSTGADPVLATLTAGANVTITNGAGSITIAANASSETVNYTSINNTNSPYSVTATDYYISADTSAGVVLVNLPNAPAVGRIFVIKDRSGTAAINNIVVAVTGGVKTIDGVVSFAMNTAYEAINVIYNGANYEIF